MLVLWQFIGSVYACVQIVIYITIYITICTYIYIKLGFVIKIKWIIHKRLFYILITSFHCLYILVTIFLFEVTYDATFISDDER